MDNVVSTKNFNFVCTRKTSKYSKHLHTWQSKKRGGVISFNIGGVHPQDLAQFLNEDKICLRVGHHCAQPLLETLNETSTAQD